MISHYFLSYILHYEFLMILIVKISLSLKIDNEMLKERYALISWQTIIPLSTPNERRKCSSYRICFDIHRWLFFLYPIWTFWNFYICISKTSCTFDTLLSQYKDNWCAITILFSIVEMLASHSESYIERYKFAACLWCRWYKHQNRNHSQCLYDVISV